MTRERQLERRREDPDPRVPVARRGVDEDRLGEVDLAGERLQLLLRYLARVGENSELIARERHVREDVYEDVTKRRHTPTVATGPASPHRRAR